MTRDLRARYVMPVHHSTFRLSREPPDEPIRRFLAAAGPERDRIVATYSLLAATGHLTAGSLNLGVPVYNPLDNFQKVKNKWAGTQVYSGK